MPEVKSKFIIPAIGASVVVAGGIAAYFYFNGASGDSYSPLASAKLVPNDAVLATFISTDSKNWSKLQQFGTPEAQNIIGKGIEDFNKQIFAESNIDYEKDLKPWVGSVMIAVLPSNVVKPIQATPQSGQKPNILMVVGIKDKLSALNFANKLKGEKGITNKESDYNGQKITETIDNGTKNYSVVLNDHLVFAPEKRAVEQAIDTFKGEPSFASKEGVGNLASNGIAVQNSLAQIYVPDYASLVQELITNNSNTPQIPAQTLAQLKQVKSVVAGVEVDDIGLRMKAKATLDPQAIKVEYKPSPGNVVAQLPSNTIAAITGQGINRNWSTLVEQSQNNPRFKQGIDQARQQLKNFNIDLDKDIFGWMDGEYAVAAIPSNQGLLAPIGFGGALVFHTSDRKTAEATFSKLDALASSYSIAVAPRNVQGKTVTEWQIPQQGALLGHGWLDQDSVFVALGGPIVDVMATTSNQALNNSETFKAVTGSLPNPNGGYFYLDMDKTMSLLNRNLLQRQNNPLSPEASAILNSIRGIGLTATSPEKTTSQVEMLLALKQNR